MNNRISYEGDRSLTMAIGNIMQQLVVKNQLLLGSVNASLNHFKMAVDYLEASREKWPDAIRQVITEKAPFTGFDNVLHSHSPNEIKVVVDWE